MKRNKTNKVTPNFIGAVAVLLILLLLGGCAVPGVSPALQTEKPSSTENHSASKEDPNVEQTIQDQEKPKTESGAQVKQPTKEEKPQTESNTQVEQPPKKEQGSQKEQNKTESGNDASLKQHLSKEEIKAIVLKHANLSSSEIWEYESDLDIEKGIKVYEIDFKAEGWEYEYVLRADNGTILFNKKEKDD